MSLEVERFLESRKVQLDPSSPTLSKTNGKAEAAVKATKKIIRGAGGDDEKILLGLNAFRNQEKEGGVPSPAELAYGRLRREALPVSEAEKRHRAEDMAQNGAKRLEDMRAKYKERANKGARVLEPLRPGQRVVVQDHQTKRWTLPGVVSSGPSMDRDYVIAMDNGGSWRRNRERLRELQEPEQKVTKDHPDGEQERPEDIREEHVHQEQPRRRSTRLRAMQQLE